MRQDEGPNARAVRDLPVKSPLNVSRTPRLSHFENQHPDPARCCKLALKGLVNLKLDPR